MYKTILSKSLVFSHLRIETFTFYTEISIWLYFFFTHENDCKSIFLGKRIKEVKKLRRRLGYSSLACKFSWILITSLDLSLLKIVTSIPKNIVLLVLRYNRF